MEIKKIVVLGPECTGKSELSEFLAGEFQTAWVEEYARRFLDTLGRPYRVEDLKTIAEGQIGLEDAILPRANRVLVCDTNLYVIKIWSEFKYGYCDPQILKEIETRKYDLYLLTYVDVPWLYDPLREHPEQREDLFELYHAEMRNQDVPFVIIKGSREERKSIATSAIQDLLRQNV